MPDTNKSQTAGRKYTVILTVMACIVVVVGGMFVGAWRKGWKKLVEADCEGNLRELGIGCREYAGKHRGQFPSKWVELNFAGDEADWAKVLRCPQTDHEIGAWAAVDLWADYRLIPGRTTNDSPDTVLAIEPLANHGSVGANVLFVDGRTEWWPQARVLKQEQE